MTRPGEQYLIECYVHKPRRISVRFIDDGSMLIFSFPVVLALKEGQRSI